MLSVLHAFNDAHTHTSTHMQDLSLPLLPLCSARARYKVWSAVSIAHARSCSFASRFREIVTNFRASGSRYQYAGDSRNFRDTWAVCAFISVEQSHPNSRCINSHFTFVDSEAPLSDYKVNKLFFFVFYFYRESIVTTQATSLPLECRWRGERTQRNRPFSPDSKCIWAIQIDIRVLTDLKEVCFGVHGEMSDELVKQLSSYRAQLQQVEAALSTDQENEDLLKLQKDLQEVIELTKDLLTAQPAEGIASNNSSDAAPPKHSWKVGDRCMALWSQDGQQYEAEIEEIDSENGTAAITFTGYGNAEVVPLHALKAAEQAKSSKEEGSKPKSKKELQAEQREYKKKKAQKKVQRMKELEQEREDQKSKWQQFNNKAYSKNKKGQVKRSIFASPESVNGKVGVGTCGIADKPMTQYNDTSKYNVRHLMPQ